MKFYTAVGTATKYPENLCVTVYSGHKEYELQPAESIIWAYCNHNIITETELLNDIPNTYNIDEIQNWFFRLHRRGLIIAGEGENGVDALYNLLKKVELISTDHGIIANLITFLYLIVIKMQSPIKVWRSMPHTIRSASMRRIRRMNPEQQELQMQLRDERFLLRILRKKRIAANEVVELFRHISDSLSPEDLKRKAMTSISNLYLNKQIRFEILRGRS